MKEINEENIAQMTATAKLHLEMFKREFRGITERVLADLVYDYLPFIESDAWTNYRSYLQLNLEQEYMQRAAEARTSDQQWAKNIRARIYAENKEELQQGLIKDLEAEIAGLKEQLSQRRWY